MNERNISKKTFASAILILVVLILLSGLLTWIIPTGSYERAIVDGEQVIVPGSFKFTDQERLPVYKWAAAPVSVLWTSDGVLIIAIIIFLLVIGGAIHVLNEARILSTIITSVVKRFKDKKYVLMGLIVFIFMCLGAFIGIFEEIVPLVPLMIALAIELKWDVLTGLGMSLVACGFGFSAAVTNPFTIGIAQEISGVPMFSGAGYRLLIFFITYIVLMAFLMLYTKRIKPEAQSTVDSGVRAEGAPIDNRKGVIWFAVVTCFMVCLVLLSPVVPAISAYNLPIIALLFIISGVGGGLLSGLSLREVGQKFFKGALFMSPGIVLILLASGVKHIIATGGIMDSILYYASGWIASSTKINAVLGIYFLVLVLNFFIGSGSAKAFIVMPIIAPLLDMIGISRQMGILAFQFGDGFSNIMYPTNAVLLISLGLASVSYPKWFKWIFKIQLVMVILSIGLLWLGLKLNY